MIIVRITGGVGNQMFQYAYAKALEEKGYKVKLDISVFETYNLHGGYQLSKYNINLDIANKKEISIKKTFFDRVGNKLKIKNKKFLNEKSLLFDNNLLFPNSKSYIQGYFQNEQYFCTIREKLIHDFQIKNQLTAYTKKVSTQIKNGNVSCSIHIRRGDYILDKKVNKIHGSCEISYYQRAIKLINNKYKNVKYFIFSDDILWVKENLRVQNAIYIISDENRIPHEDIYLMSICTHNIIANSSFSWWGAWLNQNQNQSTIAPKRWFFDEIKEEESKDIVPINWQRI